MNRASYGTPSPIMNIESARESTRPNRAERRRMERELAKKQKETRKPQETNSGLLPALDQRLDSVSDPSRDGVLKQQTDCGESDFSGVPTVTVCRSIMLLIDELRRRGYPVYDFDHKDKSVQGMQIMGQKIYFFMAKEAADER